MLARAERYHKRGRLVKQLHWKKQNFYPFSYFNPSLQFIIQLHTIQFFFFFILPGIWTMSVVYSIH